MNFNEFRIQMLLMGFVLKLNWVAKYRADSHIYEYVLPSKNIMVRVRIDTISNTIQMANLIVNSNTNLISNRGNLLGEIKELIMELD